jgi:hypothetical protein
MTKMPLKYPHIIGWQKWFTENLSAQWMTGLDRYPPEIHTHPTTSITLHHHPLVQYWFAIAEHPVYFTCLPHGLSSLIKQVKDYIDDQIMTHSVNLHVGYPLYPNFTLHNDSKSWNRLFISKRSCFSESFVIKPKICKVLRSINSIKVPSKSSVCQDQPIHLVPRLNGTCWVETVWITDWSR